jgi:hypothetical protein
MAASYVPDSHHARASERTYIGFCREHLTAAQLRARGEEARVGRRCGHGYRIAKTDDDGTPRESRDSRGHPDPHDPQQFRCYCCDQRIAEREGP